MGAQTECSDVLSKIPALIENDQPDELAKILRKLVDLGLERVDVAVNSVDEGVAEKAQVCGLNIFNHLCMTTGPCASVEPAADSGSDNSDSEKTSPKMDVDENDSDSSDSSDEEPEKKERGETRKNGRRCCHASFKSEAE